VAIHRDLIEFDRAGCDEVLDRLESLPDGAWINIEPVVDEDLLAELRAHTPHPLLRVFSAKGRPIPFATEVAASDGLSIGLEHGLGARVVPDLRERGIQPPGSWRQEQDHPKRGVVYIAPRDERAEVILSWILDASTELTRVPFRGRWSAVIARPT
jgi:hypothetical protein